MHMRMKTLGLCAVMGLGMLAFGCDESTTPTTPKVEAAADKAAAAADKATDASKSAADSAADAAKSAADAAKEKGAAAVDAAKEAGADMLVQVQKAYDDAKASLSKMPPDIEGASKYVDQLKGWQDKLPADWKAKVDELVKMLADAKAKLQAMPGMPK